MRHRGHTRLEADHNFMRQDRANMFLPFPPAHSFHNCSVFSRETVWDILKQLITWIVCGSSKSAPGMCCLLLLAGFKWQPQLYSLTCSLGNPNSTQESLSLSGAQLSPPALLLHASPGMGSSSPAGASCFLPLAWRTSKCCLVLPKSWLVLWGVLTEAKSLLTAFGEEPSRQLYLCMCNKNKGWTG